MEQEPGSLERIRAIGRDFSARLSAYPGVIGSGVGLRTAGGKITRELCVIALVSRKRPLAELAPAEILPRKVRTSNGIAPLDVLEIGQPRFCKDETKYRPIRGGCQITTAGNGGTIGGVFYDRRDTRVVFLTCNHVATAQGQHGTLPAPGTAPMVRQPGGTVQFTGDDIGRIKRHVPMLPTAPGDQDAELWARVDAAIIQPDSNIGARFRVIGLGEHPSVPLPPYPGLLISKRGKETGLTHGIVLCIDTQCTITESDGTRIRVGWPDATFIVATEDGSVFCEAGDSGSLIIDRDGAATRGLLFGRIEPEGSLGFASRIDAVMEELELETPCTGAFDAVFTRALRRRRLLESFSHLEAIAIRNAGRTKISKLRADCLGCLGSGTVGGKLERMFRRLGPELAVAIATDERFADLLEQAVGEWFIQPSVEEMLEFVLPDGTAALLKRAFARFAKLYPDAPGVDWVAAEIGKHRGKRVGEIFAARTARRAA